MRFRPLAPAFVASAAVALAAGCAAPSLHTRWGPEFATAQPRLVLTELRRERGPAGPDVVFRLRAEGMPPNTRMVVWHRSRGGVPERVPGVYLAPDGLLVSPATGRETELHASGLARGEAYDLGAANEDTTLRAYVKAVPFPVEARDGRRRIEAQLESARGDLWVVRGEGFASGEQLDAVLAAGDDVHMDHVTIGPSGSFSRVILPRTLFGRDDGSARYRVTGRGAPMEIGFAWGAQALAPAAE